MYDYQQEDDMARLYDVSIVECRGRKDGQQTNVQEKFTRAGLDRIAPLSAADSVHLSKNQTPPEWVQAHVTLRILAAQHLKYGK